MLESPTMRHPRKSLIIAAFLASAPLSRAQVPGSQTQYGTQFRADALVRQEWTRDVLDAALNKTSSDRRRFQLRPRLEVSARQFLFGVGGDFNYSTDKNLEPVPTLLRDNYKSRDVRLDLAWLGIAPTANIHIQGGRFAMPIPFTEMIWDKDLRPQGGSLTLRSHDAAGATRFGITVLGARGSHVFDDEKTSMVVVSGTLGSQTGIQSRFEVTGSYLIFSRLNSLAPFIQRQNTRVDGLFVNKYRVVDIVGRLQSGGQFPTQLTADYCWNTSVSSDNRGLWLAASAGSLQSSAIRADYVFARVDKDATLAAYGTDDFFWSTGWQGHRVDIGTRASAHASLHAVGQLQRFKDSPRIEERDKWVKRFRVEMRYTY